MQIDYITDDDQLPADRFYSLVQRVWPGDYRRDKIEEALARTLNVTAWAGDELVGCVRLLTDGYFFGCITEILVDPNYQRQGIGRGLMDHLWEASPTGIFLGAQPGKEEFFKKLGYESSLNAFQKRKPRS